MNTSWVAVQRCCDSADLSCSSCIRFNRLAGKETSQATGDAQPLISRPSATSKASLCSRVFIFIAVWHKSGLAAKTRSCSVRCFFEQKQPQQQQLLARPGTLAKDYSTHMAMVAFVHNRSSSINSEKFLATKIQFRY